MCLSVAMIGILTKYHHLHIVEGCLVKGIEDEPSGREALCALVFLAYELCQLLEVWLLKLGGELGFPTLLHSYILHNTRQQTLHKGGVGGGFSPF